MVKFKAIHSAIVTDSKSQLLRATPPGQALQSAIVTDSKGSNVTMDVTKDVSMEEAIMFLIRANTDITTTEMAEYFAVNRRTIQRDLDTLKEKGIAVRKSSKRYSHLKILDLSGESQSKDP